MPTNSERVLTLIHHSDPGETERRSRIAIALTTVPGDEAINRLLATRPAADVVAHVNNEHAGPIDPDALEQALTASDDYTVLIPGDPHWPTGLDDLGEARPYVLWANGNPELLTSPITARITITGSRAATSYGTTAAADLTAALDRSGHTIVTGAAYGIDVAATRAALAGDNPTIAVTAAGINVPYPTAHANLLHQIAAHGVIISETPPGVAPSRTRFAQRTRILAALSATVVIVEASARSGALAVAHRGLALHRTIAAVPGPITSITSSGCHRLIQGGETHLVTTADDITALTQSPQ